MGKTKLKLSAFLLSLFIASVKMGYGIEITEDFINNEIIHEEDKDGVKSTASNIIIKNNGIISSITNLGYAYSGNGIQGKNDTQVINTGVISGIGKGGKNAYYSGNGVQVTSSVINSGIIIGISTSGSQNTGNGIITSTPSILTNKGNITGTLLNGGANGGNGFFGNASVTNSGIILGKSNNGSYTGYGAVFNKREGEVVNSGIISGFSTSASSDSGNGVGSIKYQGSLDNAINSGIIKGSNQAIKGDYTSLKNFGILAGKTIVDSGNIFTNHGVTVTLDTDGSGNVTEIGNGTAGDVTLVDGSIKTVLNGSETGAVAGINTIIIAVPPAIRTVNSYLLASNLTNGGNKLIINGSGVDKGALVVDQNTTLTGSIVNGYSTAVYLNDGFGLTATDTILNGGGLKNDIAVIRGSEGNNEVILLGTSIINGSVDLGNGNDTLILANGTQINGILNGGLGGSDTLELGQNTTSKTTTNLNVLHNVSGFETINTNGDVTLFETTKVTDANTITLESGNLTLRVDPTKKDTDGKVIGHALYGNTGTLNTTGGNLVVGLNGLGENSIISMGSTTISLDANDSWWKDTDYVKTNSLVLDGKLSVDGKDINITLKENLPLEPSIPVDPEIPIVPEIPVDPETPVDPPITVSGPLYEKLNGIYKSIVSAGEIGVLANTTLIDTGIGNSYLETVNGGITSSRDEALGELLVILDQMYANNPYSYTLKSSRDSMKTFEDNLSYLTIKPNEKEWIIQGRAIYTGVKGDNVDYGKNYYGFDTGHRNYKTTTKTIGGLASFEYGLSNDSSVGFAIGGNNQDIKLKGSSEIDGNSLYLGVFAKKEIKNLKFMGGIGYQYSSLDTEREVFNKRDFLKTSDNYDVNTLSTFIEGKYVLDAGDNLKVEPKIRLSYYHVAQDGIDEGYTPNNLEMSVNKAEQDTLDLEVGVDFVKTANFKSGKLNGVLTLAAINTFGDKDESLTGRINGKNKTGSDFEIQGTKLESLSGQVGLNLEYEHTNGLIYTVGTDFEFSQNNNRNISGKVGLGYRF